MKRMWCTVKVLVTAALFVVVLASLAQAYDVSGTVSYTGTKSGRVYVTLNGDGGRFGTSISGPGNYTIQGVPNGNYVLSAFMDTTGTGARHSVDPSGVLMTGMVTVGGSPVSGADISLNDPSVIGPAPQSLAVIPSENAALVLWSTNGGVIDAESYDLYWGTSPNPDSSTATGSKTAIPSVGKDNPVILIGLSGGPFYFSLVSHLSGFPDATATAGPVSLTSPTGAATVNATIQYTGAAGTGKQLFAALVDMNLNGPPTKFFPAFVTSAASSNPVSFSNVPDGLYELVSIIDMNGNGIVDMGDIQSTGRTIVQVVSGTVAYPTGPITQTIDDSDAVAEIRTWHDSSGNWSINYDIWGLRKQPVNVTLLNCQQQGSGGTLVSGPLPLGNDGDGRFYGWSNLGGTMPAPGDTCSFHVEYADGTTGPVTGTVTGAIAPFANPGQPVGSNAYDPNPTFSWTSPTFGSNPPDFWFYLVQMSEHNGTVWWESGVIPNAQVSAFFNQLFPSGPSLQDNTMYDWSVVVSDIYGNASVNRANFSFGTPVIPLSVPASTTLTSASVNESYNNVLSVYVQGGTSPYTFSVNPADLPPGINLNMADGTLSGTPTQPGTYTFTLQVTDAASNTASGSFTLTVMPGGGALSLTTTSCPTGTVGVQYTCQLTAAGGTPPYLFQAPFGLPGGLSLDWSTGLISGTPTEVVSAFYSFDISDSANPMNMIYPQLTITINQASSTPDVNGSVNYAGSNQGRIYISAVTSNGYVGTSIPNPGPFTIRNVPNGTLTLDAFMDLDGNGARSANETSGSIQVTMNGSTLDNTTITLTDPTPVLPATVQYINAAPGEGSVILGWDPPELNGIEIADSYDVYWGNASVSPTSYYGKKNVPAGQDSPAVIDGLTNTSTLYFTVVAKNSQGDAAPSAPFGPVVVGPVVGGHTVSGTISVSGGTAPSGPLYVAVVVPDAPGASGVYFTRIANPVYPQSFTVTGVLDGTYELSAMIDANNDGVFGVGDISLSEDLKPKFTVNGADLRGINATIPVRSASVEVFTTHGKNSNDGSEWYNTGCFIRSELKRPVKVVMTGAPSSSGVTVPRDIGYKARRNEFEFWGSTSRPAPGDTYTFEVSFSDGTIETLTGQVTAVNDAFPTSVTVSNGTTTRPTFTWQPPTSPPAGFYYYNIWVGYQGMNTGSVWYSRLIPSGTTSVVYGFDGGGANLSTGTTYVGNISTRDSKGNKALIQIPPFTPTTEAGTPTTVTVTFDSNGGSAVASQTVNYSSTAAQPTNPTRAGYTFGGWYSDAGLTTAYSFTTPVTADITLYAKWTINQYTVTFDSNGGSAVASQTVNYNSTAAQPANPTRTGYTFGGWYSDAGLTTAYSFTTPVTADITLYAKWNDASKPTITSITPPQGATGVAYDAVIQVTFSEPINQATLTAQNFQVSNSAGTITGSLTYDPQSVTASFTPSSPLPSGATILIAIGNIEDLAGNKLDQVNPSFVTKVADGDYNGDGMFTIADVKAILDAALGKSTPSGPELQRADVGPFANGKPASDGVIDVSDVVVALGKVVGTLTW